MNLHGLVSGAIGTVNPRIIGLVRASIGDTTDESFQRVPAYRNYPNVPLQVQALTAGDLRQLDGLNLNGTMRAIYLYGKADGVVRSKARGGDLIVISGGVHDGVWLVSQVLEQWGDGLAAAWCKVAATLQNGS